MTDPATAGNDAMEFTSRQRRALLAAALVALTVLFLGLSLLRQYGAEEVPGARPDRGSASGQASAGELPGTRLEVPSLGIVAGLSPISMAPRRVLEPPGDVNAVGWWDRSAPYGSETGRTVLTGHTVHNGGGALGPLPRLEVGSMMRVVTPQHSYAYRTVSVIVRSKAWVREHGVEVFRQPGGDGSLVVVTCTDWDGEDYRSNVIAIAEPIAGPTDDRTAEAA